MKLVGLMLLSCVTPAAFPGDQVLGTFGFTAEPTDVRCSLNEVLSPGGFQFVATYSRSSQTRNAFVTFSATSHAAVFDGQVARSKIAAVRRFESCAECETQLQEDMQVWLISQSQARELDSVCPSSFDGFVPPVDVDAGVVSPGPGAFAFDAVLACGVLTLSVSGEGNGCDQCRQCQAHYRLVGERR
jgi:hypothetical protein